jgi:lysozyme family protein
MANFEIAYNKTMGHEGGYSNDPDDNGQETYKGISRKYHPSWPGWDTVDNYKGEPGFPSNLAEDTELDSFVEFFYKENFWDPILGDHAPSQVIAEEMFDNAVNMGITRAVRFLQTGLNVLNRTGKNYGNIVVDGRIGKNTLNALEKLLSVSSREEACLYKIMNILQGYHYINLMTKSEKQEKFARGWLNRVNFIKK